CSPGDWGVKKSWQSARPDQSRILHRSGMPLPPWCSQMGRRFTVQGSRFKEDPMTRFRALTLTAVLAGLLAGGVAFAQGPGAGRRGGPGFGGPGPGGRGGPGGLPLQALNLTEAQQDQVKQLVQQSRAQSQNVGEQLRSAMDAQRKAVETIPVDEGLIRSTTQALVEAQTE